MSKQIIPVVFATDTNYVPYCGVAISSLIQNSNPDNMYEVYVLYDSMERINVIRLENLSVEHVRVRCVCVHENIAELKVTEYNHLTIASAYRLVISEILPQYERVLYLDSDIVIIADVAEMYNIDIGNNILGAIKGHYKNDENHFMYRHIIDVLEIEPTAFFNAGILIINNKEFVNQKVKEKCFKLLSTRKDLIFMDQCALNIACDGRVFYLPEKWNYEWLMLFEDSEDIEIMDNPAIIHYDGIEKPWNYPNMLLADVFWKYADESGYKEEIKRIKEHNMREKKNAGSEGISILINRAKNIISDEITMAKLSLKGVKIRL